MAKYLKDRLAELRTPLDFEFVARSPLLTKEKKGGGTYQVYEYTFLLHGVPDIQNIFPSDHPKGDSAVLAQANKGDMCRAALNDKGYVYWTILPRGEDLLKMDNPKSSAQVKAAKDYNEGKAKEEIEKQKMWHEQAVSKIVFGYLTSFLEMGKTMEEAANLAYTSYFTQKKVAENILIKEKESEVPQEEDPTDYFDTLR